MTRKHIQTLLMTSALIVVGSVSNAADMASGAEIKAMVTGKTLQGSMLREEFSKYSEFYMEDGTLRADGYTGKWSISDDSMCFEYGGEPAGCWAASFEGPAVIWWKDGAVDGAAVAMSGNGNNY